MTSEFSVAVHALVYLYHKGTTVSSEALSKNICTHPVRVRHVMSKLKKAFIVTTKEGADGGYRLTKDAAMLSLRQIADVLDIQFVSCGWKSGDIDADCLVSSGMAGILEQIYQSLNQACSNELEQMTIAGIEQQLFQKKHTNQV